MDLGILPLGTHFRFGGIRTFRGQKPDIKKLTKFTKFLNYIRFSCAKLDLKHFGLEILKHFELQKVLIFFKYFFDKHI